MDQDKTLRAQKDTPLPLSEVLRRLPWSLRTQRLPTRGLTDEDTCWPDHDEDAHDRRRLHAEEALVAFEEVLREQLRARGIAPENIDTILPHAFRLFHRRPARAVPPA